MIENLIHDQYFHRAMYQLFHGKGVTSEKKLLAFFFPFVYIGGL